MAQRTNIRDTVSPYLFLSPWVVGFLLFSGLPILASFLLSLTKWDLLGDPEWVGFANYATLFEAGSDFYKTLQATFIFTIVAVVVTVGASLLLALLLNLKVRFVGIFQFVYFLPAVMPSVAVAAAFSLIFNKELGVANYLFSLIGIDGPNWLGNPSSVWVVIALMNLFSFSTGQMMLIFNAGLKEVPLELYEAVELDGANGLQRFVNVTLPSLSPLILFNVVIATVGSFNGAFTIVYPLTGGGPGDVTRVLSLDIFEQAFRSFNMGTASAMAVVLFAIVAIISFLQFKLSSRHVNYD
jgi:multiple sugar transport system permease protein